MTQTKPEFKLKLTNWLILTSDRVMNSEKEVIESI